MSDKTESNSKLTTVKTVYARAAMLLLAINFCLTTYVVVNLNSSVQMQVDQATGLSLEESRSVTTTTGATTKTPSGTREVSTNPTTGE